MYTMHLIINTHWDREYRWSFKETQLRLAEAVDDLIDIMQKDKEFAYFHTDSQASMLDDYLEIRPERTAELKKLVAEGRILTGPWYTLPAEFLVSGESLVRNLLLGHRIAGNLGKVMKAAYNIFSWGQVSQLPQIYRQFGMDTIVFYRGLDQSSLKSLEFIWKAPDGSKSLGLTFGSYHRLNFWRYVYLPYILGRQDVKDNGHCLGRDDLGSDGYLFNLCDAASEDINHWISNQPCARDLDAALEGMLELIDTVKDKSQVHDLLFLQGFDQENPDPIVTELIERINDKIDYGNVTVASLPEYFKKVRKGLTEKGLMENLPVREGEMLSVEKVGDAFGPLYNGVFSARMPLKLLNSDCQYLLEYWTEPVSVWGKILGEKYPSRSIQTAWKEIMKNQQHDGIGGCHVDRISQTMIERYETVRDIADAVTRDSLKSLTGMIDFTLLEEHEIGIVVFNSTQFSRSEIVTVTLDIPTDWNLRKAGEHNLRDISLKIVDYEGRAVPSQVVAIEEDFAFGYLKFGNVIGFDVSRVTAAFSIENTPANGYTVFTVKPVRETQRPVNCLSSETHYLENEYLKVRIHSNGTLSIVSKETGTEFQNLHYFEDIGEKGGPLIHTPLFERGEFTTISSSPDIELIYNGPLFTKYRITYRWSLPESLDSKIKVHVPHGSEWVANGRLVRSKNRKVIDLYTDITLYTGARKLEFETTIDNTICDHRLRVMFPTDMSGVRECMVDSPFDIVTRSISVPDSTGWYEGASRTWPSHSFITLNDGKSSFSLLHKGIPEYEVSDTPSRTLCLTLLRAFGNAGNPTEAYRYQEMAQCPGLHKFKYALMIGKAVSEPSSILAESLTFNVPVRVAQTTRHSGSLGLSKSFFTISDPRFIVTAVKESEDEKAVVIRGFNASDYSLDLVIKFDFPVRSVKKINLEENVEFDISVSQDGRAAFSVGHKEIAGLLIIL